MTVLSDTNKNQYSCDGSQTVFPYTFRILDETHIQVVLTDSAGSETILTLNTDYTVSGVDDIGGGNITTVSTYASGYTLTFIRDIPATQETDYVENDSFPAESHEQALDKITMLIQQMKEELSRCPALVASSPLSNLLLPVSASRVLGWDSAGAQLTTYPTIPVYSADFDTIRNYSNSLPQMVTDIGPGNATVLIDVSPNEVTADLTVPDNIHLVILQGCLIPVAPGITLTIESLEAGRYQIFSGAGTVALTKTEIGFPEWMGQIDGTADEVQINAIAQSGVRTVSLEEGTYTCNAEILLPKGVNLQGQGKTKTILDFRGASGTFTYDACIYNAGDGLVLLGVLASNITAGDSDVVLGSAPAVSPGDIIVIYDSADGSYLAERTYYRAGEYGEVDSVSGNTITLSHAIEEDYTSGGTVSVYHLSNPTGSKISDIQVKGIGAGSTVNDIIIRYGRGVVLSQIKTTGSEYANISITQSYDCIVDKIWSEKRLADVYGTSYALTIVNSQEITVKDSHLVSIRHGISFTGGDYVGCVPNRWCDVENCHITTLATTGSVLAANTHGNSEYITFRNNVLHGGIVLGGNHNTVENNKIYDDASELIHLAEMEGFDFTIRGNITYSTREAYTDRGYFLDIGGNSSAINANTKEGGTFTIANNTSYMSIADSVSSLLRIRQRGCTQTDLRIDIHNNRFIQEISSTGGQLLNIEVISGAAYERVDITDNILYGPGISVVGAKNVYVSGNIVKQSGNQGIQIRRGTTITEAAEEYVVINNFVKGAQLTGIYVGGGDGSHLASKIVVSNNISLENNHVTTGSSYTDAPLSVFYAVDVYVNDNIVGGTQAAQYKQAGYYMITNLYEDQNRYFGTGNINYGSITNQWGNIQAHISDPSGGSTVDAEARAAINDILDILENMKLMKP